MHRNMENLTYAGVFATTVLDTRRAKDELWYPVKYRITYMGKQYYFPSGIDLTEDEWKVLPTTKKRELVEQKELIQAGFDLVWDHAKELLKAGAFSIDALKKRLSKGRKESLMEALDAKINTLNEAGQIGTAISYSCAKNSIAKFTSKDLRLSDITVDWLRRYHNHMEGEDKTPTTIKFYMGCIRVIMNDAKRDGIITEAGYPFGEEANGKYEIKTGEGRKLALSLAQIKSVLEYQLNSEIEERSRDLWFFSYLCNGINFNDMLKLKYKDIAGGEIHFTRQKTKRTSKNKKIIAATLLPDMKAIIERWGNKPRRPDSYIFPFLNDKMDPLTQKMTIQNAIRLVNKKMKKISDALNLDTISTYTARHSFATVLKRSGANIAFISESLGHTDLRTTENYLASFETEERAKNASKLVQF
jgi:integrase